MVSITEKIAAGGSCIARMDGKAVFVPLTLPGETIEYEIVENKKDYAFGKLVSVLEPSPHRIEPPCPLFGICGGCDLQMADSAYQRELRLSILRDSLRRSGVNPPPDIAVHFGNPLEYRSRFQFHRSKDGLPGLRREASHEIVPVNDCPVAVKSIREGLKDHSIAAHLGTHPAISRCTVFSDGTGYCAEGVVSSTLVELMGKRLEFSVSGFFQSNLEMLRKLGESLALSVSGKRLLDFYAGVGTFSVFLSENFEDTLLVEQNREALDFAKKNLNGLSITSDFCALTDESWPASHLSRRPFDCAIVDPPRLGMGKKTVDWFIKSGIQDILYVSCDPVTFSRDAKKLIDGGYFLESVALYDFYPQTHHIETLGHFTKRVK